MFPRRLLRAVTSEKMDIWEHSHCGFLIPKWLHLCSGFPKEPIRMTQWDSQATGKSDWLQTGLYRRGHLHLYWFNVKSLPRALSVSLLISIPSTIQPNHILAGLYLYIASQCVLKVNFLSDQTVVNCKSTRRWVFTSLCRVCLVTIYLFGINI